MGPPSDALLLRDGSRVSLRPIGPEDEELLHEAFGRMSERSVYLRFFSPLKRLPEALAHRLANVDQRDRYALGAFVDQPGGGQHLLGVARYDRAPRTDTAEVAAAVIDDAQRSGLGSALMLRLAGVARDQGIHTFTLIVLPENTAMLALLKRLGWEHRVRVHGGVIEITMDLAPGSA